MAKLRKIFTLVLCVVMSVMQVITVSADEIIASGFCGADGENLTWSLSSDGIMTITGSGDMEDYGYSSDPPWEEIKDEIRTLIIDLGVTSIGEYAFYGCSQLLKVDIPGTVTDINNSAFAWCENLTGIEIPEGVEYIGQYAFSRCYGFASIYIPASVNFIDGEAFWDNYDIYDDRGLARIDVSEKNEAYTSIDGVLFSKDMTALIIYPEGHTGETYSVPTGVESINRRAFDGSFLKQIQLPIGLKKICSGAFENCYDLTEISIPDTVITLESFAFEHCRALTSVKLPTGINLIPSYIFDGCSSLENIEIPNGVAEIARHSFDGCESLKTVTIPRTIIFIGEDAFDIGSYYWCDLETVNYMGNERQWDGIIKGEGNDQLLGANIVFGNSPDYGQCGETTYWSVDGDTLTISGTGAMEDYPVIYPQWTIYDYSKLVIEDGITHIGQYSFYETYYSRESLKTVGECHLNTVYIPASVEEIGPDAFAECNKLEYVYYSGTKEDWARIDISDSNNECLTENAKIIFNYGSTTAAITDVELNVDENNNEITLTVSTNNVPASATMKAIGFGKNDKFLGISSIENGTAILASEDVQSVKVICWESPESMKPLCPAREVAVPGQEIVDSGYCGADGENLTWELNARGELTVDGSGEMESWEYGIEPPWGNDVTEVLLGDSVTNIGDFAFANCVNLEKVIIGENVTHIGNRAFISCENITTLNVPDSVLSIDEYAFFGCYALKNLILGKNVADIGDAAFWDCRGLTSVSFPDSLTQIGEGAFLGCSGLESIVIPSGMNQITSQSFSGCTGLKSVTIPKSVTNIGYGAFRDCNNIVDIYYQGTQEQWEAIYKASNNLVLDNAEKHFDGQDLPEIIEEGLCGDKLIWTLDADGTLIISGEGDMWDFWSLQNGGDGIPWRNFKDKIKSVVITDGVTSIGDNAFMDWGGDGPVYDIKEIHIADTVKRIGTYAINSLSDIPINIPDSVEYIGGQIPFYNVNFLIDFTENSNLMYMESSTDFEAFYDSLPDGATYIGKCLVAYKGTIGRNFKIKDGTVSIAGGAFEGCTNLENLENIEAPDSLTIVNQTEFENTKWYKNQNDGVVYLGKIAYGYKGDKSEDKTISVKNGTISIANRAFYEHNISKLSLPDTVQYIGDMAFQSTSISDVELPLELKYLGMQAFYQTNVTEVYITPNVQYIGELAFDDSLISVRVDADNDFYCAEDNALFNKDKTVMYGYGDLNCDTYVVPESVKIIKENSLSGAKNIILNEGVENIDHWAIVGNVETIVLPKSLKTIGGYNLSHIKNKIYYCGSEDEWNLMYISWWGNKRFGEDDEIIYYCDIVYDYS